jgi:hypothetical protein
LFSSAFAGENVAGGNVACANVAGGNVSCALTSCDGGANVCPLSPGR